MTKGVSIRKSDIAGRGIFACQDYNPGEIIFQLGGRIIHSRFIDWHALGEKGMYYLQVSPWKYLEPKDPRLKYLNHSCNPNSGCKLINGKLSIIAIKPIKRDDEIKFDYSTTMLEEWDEPVSVLKKCHCGSKNCRGSIRDFRNLPKPVQRKYIRAGVVLDYILKNLKRTKKNGSISS